jgi:hypothetical protein
MPQLELHILGARGLFNTQLVGTIDPYCIVKYDGKKWETNVCEDSENPQWDTIFRFNLSDPQNAELHFVIKNKNMLFDDTIGICNVKVDALTRGIAAERVVKLDKCLGKEADLRFRLTAIDFGIAPFANNGMAQPQQVQQQFPPQPQQPPPPQQYSQPPSQSTMPIPSSAPQQPQFHQQPSMQQQQQPMQPFPQQQQMPPAGYGAPCYPAYLPPPPMPPPSLQQQQYSSFSPQSYPMTPPPPSSYDAPSPPARHCLRTAGLINTGAPPPPLLPPADAAMSQPDRAASCYEQPSKHRSKRRHGHHHGHGHGSHGRNWKPWLHHPEMAQPMTHG